MNPADFNTLESLYDRLYKTASGSAEKTVQEKMIEERISQLEERLLTEDMIIFHHWMSQKYLLTDHQRSNQHRDSFCDYVEKFEQEPHKAIKKLTAAMENIITPAPEAEPEYSTFDGSMISSNPAARQNMYRAAISPDRFLN